MIKTITKRWYYVGNRKYNDKNNYKIMICIEEKKNIILKILQSDGI